jgi:hypothetical protein
VTATPPRELVGFCLDCFLLARHAPPGPTGRPDGRAWERAVSGLLWRPGLPRRQHAGTIGLFGAGSASGAGHEIDGAGHGARVGIWIEAKARAAVGKSDIAVFDMKCADLYRGAAHHNPDATRADAWWPLFVTSEPASEPVRRLCMSLGIVLCDPLRIPLPVLLRVAGNPEGDMHLPETMLAEAVRLFERPCSSMQERWQISNDGRSLVLALDGDPEATALADALYVQDTLTEDLLDYFDLEAPGQLEHRADELALRLARHARAAA